MTTIKPYENEEESLTIGGMTIENRLDRVSLYGSLQLTKDKAGLALALELQSVLDVAVRALQQADLPDTLSLKPTTEVDNPFQ